MLDGTHRFPRRFRRAGAAAIVAIAAVVLASCGDSTGPDNQQNALRPASDDADKILDLTRPFFWIAVIIGVGVTAGTIYVAVRFRQKPGEDRMPVQTHGNTVLEVGWTIVPALILAVMAVPTIATVFDLADQPKGPDVINITVTARQWWWQFHYDDEGNGVETANELHIPVDTPVALTLQGPPACSEENCYANGVIHSFWVPELNGKKDVVPGRTHYLRLKAGRIGEFRGQCAEYCGLAHADMGLRVIVHDKAGYDAWVRDQNSPRPVAELTAGVNNERWACASCHSFEAGKAGSVGPNLARLADRKHFAAEKYEMTYDNLWRWVYDAPGRKPMGDLNPTQKMPSFKNEGGMTEDEAKDIACFLLENTASDPQPVPECAGR
jgi:cytochrome c oxidase subunit 2